MKQQTSDQSLLSWGLLIILALIWGTSFILIKKGLVAYSPGEVGALRIISAGVFLMPFALPALRKIDRKYRILLFVVGLNGSFIPAFLFAKAQTQIESSVSGVLNGLTPIFTLIIGAVIFHQRIGPWKYLGIFIGFLGTAWLAMAGSSGLGDINYYVLYIVAATVMYGFNLNLIKYKIQEVRALDITSISLLLVLPFALAYLFLMTNFTDKFAMAEGGKLAAFYVALLGVMSTAVALILFNRLVKMTTPIFASSVTYLIPIVAIGWGLLDGEILTVNHYVGIVLIILGIYVSRK